MNLKSNLGLGAIFISFLFLLFVGWVGTSFYLKFNTMLVKSKEGANKGSLGAIKSAASIYYGDSKGIWPRNLEKDLAPKYLKTIPLLHLERYGHPSSSQVEYYPFLDSQGKVDPKLLKDTGHWLYDPKTGSLVIDCTHKDVQGKPIYQFGF